MKEIFTEKRWKGTKRSLHNMPLENGIRSIEFEMIFQSDFMERHLIKTDKW